MSPPTTNWPRWLVLLVSVPLVYHLGGVVFGALAGPSGPWLTPDGPSMALPPTLASVPYESAAAPYLRSIKLTHNYHFPSNRPGGPDAYLEVRLEDGEGRHLETVRVPDPAAPPLARQRQALLVRSLLDDQPVQPPAGERIYAPGQQPPRLPIWEMSEPGKLFLGEVSELEIPRNRMVFRPTDWSLVVVRSTARHLCRKHGAAKAQVIRHSRNAVHPGVLLSSEPVPPIEDLVSDYGRFSR